MDYDEVIFDENGNEVVQEKTGEVEGVSNQGKLPNFTYIGNKQ